MAEDKKTDERPLSLEIDDSEAARRGLLEQEEKQAASPMAPQGGVVNNPVVAIACYCGSSILMTTTNKYVMSGVDFNLSFFLLAIQVRRLGRACM
jgi:GDP-mannose transporter